MEVTRHRGMFTIDQISPPATSPTPPESTISANDYHATKTPRILEDQASKFCSGCGRTGHTRSGCGFTKFAHPDHSPGGSISWRRSATGSKWFDRGFNSCPVCKTLSGQPYDFSRLEAFVKSYAEIGRTVTRGVVVAYLWGGSGTQHHPDKVERLPTPLFCYYARQQVVNLSYFYYLTTW